MGFFFNDTATTEIYTLSLHDALPIWVPRFVARADAVADPQEAVEAARLHRRPEEAFVRHRHVDRKSTRLNSSHANISYAVFCLKKKYKPRQQEPYTQYHETSHANTRD